MPSSSSPLPPEVRNRALSRGATALAGAVAGFLGIGRLAALLDPGDQWTAGIMRAVLVVADVALIYAVWQLGRARNHRWDVRGCLSLLAMFIAWPVLLLFTVWTVFALFVLVTGRPLRLFGD